MPSGRSCQGWRGCNHRPKGPDLSTEAPLVEEAWRSCQSLRRRGARPPHPIDGCPSPLGHRRERPEIGGCASPSAPSRTARHQAQNGPRSIDPDPGVCSECRRYVASLETGRDGGDEGRATFRPIRRLGVRDTSGGRPHHHRAGAGRASGREAMAVQAMNGASR